MNRPRIVTPLLGILLLMPATLPASGEPVSARTTNSAAPGYMSRTEYEIVSEINRMRTNPAAYAKNHLMPLRAYFDGRSFKRPGEITIITNEGLAALDECIRVLMNTSPLPPLTPSRGLTLAARDQVKDQGATGSTGHNGSDGSTMLSRIERYGQWKSMAAENISYGYSDARDIVISLLVDDGVPSRGHRKNLLNDRFSVVGVKTGPHRLYNDMCVIDFAGGYTLKSM